MLNEADRNIAVDGCANPLLPCFSDITGDGLVSTNWAGEGYYRFEEPAGVQMPESSPGPTKCATYAPGYLMGAHGTEDGVEEDKMACFELDDDDCVSQEAITVTKCDGFYVYKLPDIDQTLLMSGGFPAPSRYCAGSAK